MDLKEEIRPKKDEPPKGFDTINNVTFVFLNSIWIGLDRYQGNGEGYQDMMVSA